MRDQRDLMKMLRGFKTELPKRIAEGLAEVMDEETAANFRKEAYTGDGVSKKWANRKDRQGNDVEQFLNYPKLQYSKRLRRSFRKNVVRISSKNYNITYGTNVPYAKLHNEGYQSGMPINGSSNRVSPYSSKPISLGRRPQKRQFLGIGRGTSRRFELKMKFITQQFMKKV